MLITHRQYNNPIPREIPKSLFLPLVCVYCFIVQFGALFRLSTEESVYGLSTLIGLTLIIIGVRRILHAFFQEIFFQMVLILAIWMAIAGSSSEYNEGGAMTSAVVFLLYGMLSATLARTYLTEYWLRQIWFFMVLGMGLSGILTIIDYIGIIDIPWNNEIAILSHVDGVSIQQASGFFPRRSAMAAYFSIPIAGAFTLAILHYEQKLRLFYLVTGSVGLICLFLTHNRSGVLSIVLSLALYIVYTRGLYFFQRFRFVFLGLLAISTIISVMIIYFPDHLAVYARKLSFLSSFNSSGISESDYRRLYLLQVAIGSWFESPVGNGFTRLPVGVSRFMDPHSIVTAIVWGTGIFSVLWLPFCAFLLYRLITRLNQGAVHHRSIYIDATSCGLYAWFINNLVHNSMNTGLAWILLGVAISLSRCRSGSAMYIYTKESAYFKRIQPLPSSNSSSYS
jgi:hypothetical protein